MTYSFCHKHTTERLPHHSAIVENEIWMDFLPSHHHHIVRVLKREQNIRTVVGMQLGIIPSSGGTTILKISPLWTYAQLAYK